MEVGIQDFGNEVYGGEKDGGEYTGGGWGNLKYNLKFKAATVDIVFEMDNEANIKATFSDRQWLSGAVDVMWGSTSTLLFSMLSMRNIWRRPRWLSSVATLRSGRYGQGSRDEGEEEAASVKA